MKHEAIHWLRCSRPRVISDMVVAAETDEGLLARVADPAVSEPADTPGSAQAANRASPDLPHSKECRGTCVRGCAECR